jgi:hypothetical protein
VPDGRLFVAPGCGHEVMSRKPGLFNEALAGFFRSTATVAAKRAAHASEATHASDAAQNPLAEPPDASPGTDSDWVADASR